jgi:hypothetical protein
MLKIAHRGNTRGPSPRENHPFYIEEAIAQGFDVEVDVWLSKKNLWLGHDKPQYMTSKTFLDRYKDSLWIHCKNLAALEYFVSLKKDYKYFWHEHDSYTLTSNGLIWTYPGKSITNQSIIVLQDSGLPDECKNAFGICSDYVSYLSKDL